MASVKITQNAFEELAKGQGIDLKSFDLKELHIIVQETLASLESLDDLDLENTILVPSFFPFSR
jgi:hypothetical protein